MLGRHSCILSRHACAHQLSLERYALGVGCITLDLEVMLPTHRRQWHLLHSAPQHTAQEAPGRLQDDSERRVQQVRHSSCQRVLTACESVRLTKGPVANKTAVE
jgi:hypothetical protein